MEICDFTLEGYKTQLESIQSQERRLTVQKQFEKDRSSMILPLVNSGGCMEAAANLSEKYFEFYGLVRICEMTNDNERLDRYMDVFAEQVP